MNKVEEDTDSSSDSSSDESDERGSWDEALFKEIENEHVEDDNSSTEESENECEGV